MTGDQGGQCCALFTNDEECGKNTAWKYCSVLRETGYSFLFITTHCCWEMPWDRPWWHLSPVWARHILQGSSVPVGKMSLFSSKCFELINKDSAHCISHEESSAHINCFHLGVKGIAFPPYFFPPEKFKNLFQVCLFSYFFYNFFFQSPPSNCASWSICWWA